MSFPEPPKFNTPSGETSSQPALGVFDSFFSYTDSLRACALCGQIKNNQYHHQPADMDAEEVQVQQSRSRRASYSVILEISGCKHAFHQACMMSWLEEGITGDVKSSGRIERVPAVMRSTVPAARCAICGSVQALVGKTGFSASGLLERMHAILLRRLREWEAKERWEAEDRGRKVGESQR